MADYRDEKETLRRRVAQLEERLEELTVDDAQDEQTIAGLREERDELRDERDQAQRMVRELTDTVKELEAQLIREEDAERDETSLARLPLWSKMLGLGLALVIAAAPASYVSGRAGLFVLVCAMGVLLLASMLKQRHDLEANRAEWREARRPKRKKPKVRVRTDKSAPPPAEAQARRRPKRARGRRRR